VHDSRPSSGCDDYNFERWRLILVGPLYGILRWLLYFGKVLHP